MSIAVIEFVALQPHWILARWDASIPHTLERLILLLDLILTANISMAIINRYALYSSR
jgi:hypothetical protein